MQNQEDQIIFPQLLPPPGSVSARANSLKNLFIVGTGAILESDSLTINVDDSADGLFNSVIEVSGGTIKGEKLNIRISDNSLVIGLYIGEKTAAESVRIENSNPGKIDIDENNEDSSIIFENISNNNPDIPQTDISGGFDVTTEQQLEEALSKYGMAKLLNDIVITNTDTSEAGYSLPSKDDSTVVNLNGHTLVINLEIGYTVPESESTTFNDGTLLVNLNNTDVTNSGITVHPYANLTLDNVTLNSNVTGIMTAYDAASIKIVDSEIFVYGYYAIGTNASNSANGVNITISNSLLEVGNKISELGIPMDSRVLKNTTPDSDSNAVLYNVAGTLNIDNSTIIGGSQAVIVRGATRAEIKNSTLIGGNETSYGSYFDAVLAGNWQQGNGVPYATLMVGNRNGGSYPLESICIVENTSITVAKDCNYENAVPVYLAADDTHRAELTIADEYANNITYFGKNCYLNGTNLPADADGKSNIIIY